MSCSIFFKLPPELRNVIYEEVLVPDSPIAVVDWNESYGHEPIPALLPPLLQVCRELRQEASQVYYGMNIFLFNTGNDKHLQLWLKVLVRIDRSSVRQIRLDDTLCKDEDEIRRRVQRLRVKLELRGLSVEQAIIFGELAASTTWGESQGSGIWLAG